MRARNFDRFWTEEDYMTAYDNSSNLRTLNSPAPPFWVCLVLGIVMVLAGVMVLSDIMFFTVISALFIGWMSVAAGAFEIFHAFWIKWWGGFAWQVRLGILYIAFGLVLISQPFVGSLIITYLLGLLLVFSGSVRIVLGAFYWKELGWSMPFSGAFGILAGLVILTGFPETGLWVLGFLFGIDLISHGLAWLIYAARR
jgi:uncharacterized membrane protein HdeD (DUF308 family)